MDLSEAPDQSPTSLFNVHPIHTLATSAPISLQDQVPESAGTSVRILYAEPLSMVPQHGQNLPLPVRRRSSPPLESGQYTCENCGKIFSDRSGRQNLWRHKQSVCGSKSKTHNCEVCGKMYRRTDALKKHVWKKHPGSAARLPVSKRYANSRSEAGDSSDIARPEGLASRPIEEDSQDRTPGRLQEEHTESGHAMPAGRVEEFTT